MDVPFFGGCACGAVRYECSAAPVTMVNCHCRDCQRAGGAGFSPTAVVPAESFRLLRGEPKRYSVTAESGHTAHRAFCGACGAPLFASSSARQDFIGIRAGSLDDPSWFRPQAEVWTASAQPWDYLSADVPHFVRNRERPADASLHVGAGRALRSRPGARREVRTQRRPQGTNGTLRRRARQSPTGEPDNNNSHRP
jgi:hypothetical protein